MNSFNILLKTPRAINCTMILLLFFTMGCKDVEEDKVVVTEEIEGASGSILEIVKQLRSKEFKIKRGYLWENFATTVLLATLKSVLLQYA